MVEFSLLISRQLAELFPLDEVPYSLARGFRRRKVNDITGTERRDKLDDLVVRLHKKHFGILFQQ